VKAASRGPMARSATLLTPIAAALQFLTILPPVVRRAFTGLELGRSTAYFPLVGILLGVILAGMDVAARRMLPSAVGAAVLLAAWVVLTGALHLDGYLDSCDALFGGWTPADRLRILRDERVGAFAVAGGVLLMLVKYATLASIQRRGSALILAATLGRWAMTLAILAYPYLRPEGLGRSMKDHAGRPQGLISTVIAVAAVAAFGGRFGLIVAACAIAAGWWVARCGMRRLEGLTGDLHGAACEVAEAVALLAWSACETCFRLA
jgi:adenosylcobinamide-GDP ribazoletransferase